MKWAKSINSRFLINQWSLAFGDLEDIWAVIDYLRLSHEWFHLDEVLVLFTAYFSPKTPSILSTASISNVRPPGICSCQAERGAAWDWPWPAHQGDAATSQQAVLGAQGECTTENRGFAQLRTWHCKEKHGDGQGGLVCCSPWGRKELDTTERLSWSELNEDAVQNRRALPQKWANTTVRELHTSFQQCRTWRRAWRVPATGRLAAGQF